MSQASTNLLQEVRSLCQSGDLMGAAHLSRDALKEDPDNWEMLHLMAVTLNEAGLVDQALPFFQRCLAIRGADSSVLFNYGVALRKLSRFREAARAFRHAADATPGRFDCWFNLGESLARLGQFAGAVEALFQAAEIEPVNADVWYILGNLHLAEKQFDAAIEYFEKAVSFAPGHGEAFNNLGLALKGAGRLAAAVTAFGQAIDADPASPAAHDNLGNARMLMGDTDGAIASFREALRLMPDYADARFNLAGVYLEQRDFAAAETDYRRVLKADPDHRLACLKAAFCAQMQGDAEAARIDLDGALDRWPEDTDVLSQLGNVMRDIGAFEKSRDYFQRALEPNPDNPVVLGNLALACQHEGALSESVDHYRRALTLDSDNAQLHTNLAQALLLAENYPDGWAEFEHRLSDPVIAGVLENLPGEPWSGEPLGGKTILLQAEQGLGDIIQFVRYAAKLSDQGARVLLAGPGRLAHLLSEFEALAGYIDAAGPMPFADYHAPLMSMPHILKCGVIGGGEAYLSVDPSAVAHWRDRLHPVDGFKIGFAWQGNIGYEMDYARSMPAALIAQSIAAADAQLFVLQQGYGRAQLDELSSHTGVVDLGDDVDRDAAFADTAAIMANLDLVITSDTAIAHLAGALGRPVWVLLPFAPDWRWLLGRPDSPWYRSMRLFRQPKPRDWPSALAQLGECLDRWRLAGGDPNSAADTGLGLD